MKKLKTYYFLSLHYVNQSLTVDEIQSSDLNTAISLYQNVYDTSYTHYKVVTKSQLKKLRNKIDKLL